MARARCARQVAGDPVGLQSLQLVCLWFLSKKKFNEYGVSVKNKPVLEKSESDGF
jgi:hypothetical protein